MINAAQSQRTDAAVETNELLRGDQLNRLRAIMSLDTRLFKTVPPPAATELSRNALLVLDAIDRERDERLLSKHGMMLLNLQNRHPDIFNLKTSEGISLVQKSFEVVEVERSSTVVPHSLLDMVTQIGRYTMSRPDPEDRQVWQSRFSDRLVSLTTKLIPEQVQVTEFMESRDFSGNEEVAKDLSRRHTIVVNALKALEFAGTNAPEVEKALETVLERDLKRCKEFTHPVMEYSLKHSVGTLLKLSGSILTDDQIVKFKALLGFHMVDLQEHIDAVQRTPGGVPDGIANIWLSRVKPVAAFLNSAVTSLESELKVRANAMWFSA